MASPRSRNASCGAPSARRCSPVRSFSIESNKNNFSQRRKGRKGRQSSRLHYLLFALCVLCAFARHSARQERTMSENEVAASIIDAALKVHRTLGPGLLEKVYEAAMALELRKRGFMVD